MFDILKKTKYKKDFKILLLRKILILKKKKKKKLKHLFFLRKKFLKLYNYKLLRKRNKLNFINFFEQSENELQKHKKLSLFLSKYRSRNLFWFNDFHNYTFFQKYFILKRDKFWYSIARTQSLKRHHDGRNMFSDSWNNNFLLQQKTVFLYKENLIFSYLNRNNNNFFCSLLLLQQIKIFLLKKYFICLFIYRILVVYLFVNIFFSMYFNQLNFFFFLLIFVSFFPYIFYYFYYFIVKKFHFYKVSLLLNLRKSYIYNVNLLFFIKFFIYFLNLLFYYIFFLKKKKDFFFIGFFSNFYFKKVAYIKNQKYNKFILILILFLNFLIFTYVYINIYNFLFYNELIFFNFFYDNCNKILFLLTFFSAFYIFKISRFILLLLQYNNHHSSLLWYFFNVNLYMLNFISETMINFFIKFYFNNDYKKFSFFLNNFFFHSFYYNFKVNDLLEQFVLLKNIKNIQYFNTFYKLKKNAI